MPTSPESATKKRKTRHPGWTFRMSRQEPGITQLGLAQHGLLSFVDELLLNIIDHIDSHKALCCLAATCMRFQGLVEPYIWRKLLVLKGTHAQDIARAFDAREIRMEYVQDLSIRYQNECRDGIEQLNHSFAFMSKLRHLTIETPCPNNSEWMSNIYFDGWSRIEYPAFLAYAAMPMPGGPPPTIPALQSRKNYHICFQTHMLTYDSYSAWAWRRRQEIPPWTDGSSLSTPNSPQTHYFVHKFRR
jgi:hypothetical protein